MELYDKRIGIIGLGKSGHGLVTYLSNKASRVIAFDSKTESRENYKICDYPNVEFNFGSNPSGDEEVDMVILSPGISLDHGFVNKFIQRGIEVIGEVELAFRLAQGSFVGITGTNGKTTTTALTGQIFKDAGIDARIVGNIGKPIITEVENSDSATVFVTELSSFQLETIKEFNCSAGVIINITPDHLDRHKTLENYARIKTNIFKNQTPDDFAIINLDDKLSSDLTKDLASKKIYVSVYQTPDAKTAERAIFIKDGKIIYRNKLTSTEIIKLEEIFIKGRHNYENVLCATGLALSFGIEISSIAKTLKEFKGVEHRLEFVKEIKGVSYINDSKGTNPDASIKALEAIEGDIILIAGGYDKKSDFKEFVKAFENRVKLAIILGETKEILKSEFEASGFTNYKTAQDMEDAVKKANAFAEKGDTVLLSPACASWDMYTSFEQRGDHFKALVNKLV